MSLFDWIILIAVAIAGVVVMGAVIESWLRSRGKNLFGDDDFSEMDPP